MEVSAKRLYSAEELAEAIQAAAKGPDRFLSAEDVDGIASELGVSVEAVRRELEAPSNDIAKVPGLRIDRSEGHVRLAVSPPGFRAPIITQVVVALTAAGLTLYWLRDHPYWVLGFGLIWIYWISMALSLAYRRTRIQIAKGSLELRALGWLSDEHHRFEQTTGLELSIKKAGERMLVEFFPTYYLEVCADGERAAILEGHDVATLEAVKKAIARSVQRPRPANAAEVEVG